MTERSPSELNEAIKEATNDLANASRGFLRYNGRTRAASHYWSHRQMIASNWLAALLLEKFARSIDTSLFSEKTGEQR